MAERATCQSGEEHKWKRVVKCVVGQETLQSGGLDYSTGQLHQNLYKFKECKLYSKQGSQSMNLFLWGALHSISHTPASRLFKSGVTVTAVSGAQFDNAPQGSTINPATKLVKAHGAYFVSSAG